MFVSVFCEFVRLFSDDRQGDANTNITAHPHENTQTLIDGLMVCGFAQMGLHLSQDPCCLHSDPQRMVIQQLSFVNVRFLFFFFFYSLTVSISLFLRTHFTYTSSCVSRISSFTLPSVFMSNTGLVQSQSPSSAYFIVVNKYYH